MMAPSSVRAIFRNAVVRVLGISTLKVQDGRSRTVWRLVLTKPVA
jgi:hypothetical protein